MRSAASNVTNKTQHAVTGSQTQAQTSEGENKKQIKLLSQVWTAYQFCQLRILQTNTTDVSALQGCKKKIVSDRWRRVGSHPEAGAVCVGADHGEAISWLEASAHSEGDEAGIVPGHKVLKGAENGI